MDSKIDANDALAQLPAMIEQLESYLKEMRGFVKERERLGEYDTSASAIIELSKVTLLLMEFQLVAMRTLVERLKTQATE